MEERNFCLTIWTTRSKNNPGIKKIIEDAECQKGVWEWKNRSLNSGLPDKSQRQKRRNFLVLQNKKTTGEILSSLLQGGYVLKLCWTLQAYRGVKSFVSFDGCESHHFGSDVETMENRNVHAKKDCGWNSGTRRGVYPQGTNLEFFRHPNQRVSPPKKNECIFQNPTQLKPNRSPIFF